VTRSTNPVSTSRSDRVGSRAAAVLRDVPNDFRSELRWSAGARAARIHELEPCRAEWYMTKGAIAKPVVKANPDPMGMFVKLYDLPDSRASFERLRQEGIQIRRALTAEKHKVAAWVRENFAEGWASEAEVAFGRQPVSCFIAVQDGRIVLQRFSASAFLRWRAARTDAPFSAMYRPA
jgi:hypothetical protein